jgi:hypothetical protein
MDSSTVTNQESLFKYFVDLRRNIKLTQDIVLQSALVSTVVVLTPTQLWKSFGARLLRKPWKLEASTSWNAQVVSRLI